MEAVTARKDRVSESAALAGAGPVTRVCFSYDDGAVLSAAEDGCVMLWRREGEREARAAGLDPEVRALMAAADGGEGGRRGPEDAGGDELEGLDRRSYLAAMHPPTGWTPPGYAPPATQV